MLSIKMSYLALLIILLSACNGPMSAPTIQQSTDIPIDVAVYRIDGTVMGDTEQMVRQVAPASGVAVNGYMSYSGPVIDGKTILTLSIDRISTGHDTHIEWVSAGQSIVLKCVDTKCIALRPGNRIVMICRRQYEPLTRGKQEAWDADRFATWELDYCRLETGVIE